jgi:Holliday junction resolvasome RuvABC endonuclease subunit
MVIMSVDPGTVNCGISFWELNEKMEVTKIVSYNLHMNENLPVFNRIIDLEYKIDQLVKEFKPIWLAIEAGFINRLRPAAYGPIANTIFVIERVIYFYNGFNTFTEIPPKRVKQLIGATGSADKDDVKNAVSKIKEITNLIDINQLTEHQIDSLAIGYVFINFLRENMEFFMINFI